MQTAIIIPARLQATRLPGKPLAKLGDVPLVVRVAQQALKTPDVDAVVVATDAPAIAAAAREFGIQSIMTSAKHASGTDRVAEAAATLQATYVVNVQGDEPFIDPRDLHALICALRGGAAMATLCHPITEPAQLHDPNVVKVVRRDDGTALYFSRSPIPHPRNPQPGAVLAQRHVGVYGFHATTLRAFCAQPPHPLERCEGLEQLRALAMGLTITVLDAYTAGRGVDTEADLAWARAHWAAHHEVASSIPNRQAKGRHENP